MSDVVPNSFSINQSFQGFVERPLWSDGFRPFFPLAAVSALGYILYWGLSLSGLVDAGAALDPFLLHRYDMIFGYLTAAMVGFLATAVPAWSNTRNVAGGELLGLCLVWIAGRVAFWLIGIVPAWVAFGLHFLFLALAAIRLLPPLWTARMRHLVWPVLLLMSAQGVAATGYIVGEGIPLGPLVISFETGLALAEGAFAIMVLTALAAISTAIVNIALEEAREDGVKFIPRPPIRRVAFLCISLYTLARIAEASDALQGWLAIASACAILNILQDWHMRGALSTFYSRCLYGIYWLLAIGLAMQGGGLLEIVSEEAFIAGRHMLFIGGFSYPTLLVLIIAGSRHSGHSLEPRLFFSLAIVFMLAACLFRAILPLTVPSIDWMIGAWLCFALSFVCYLVQFLPWAFAENADE